MKQTKPLCWSTGQICMTDIKPLAKYAWRSLFPSHKMFSCMNYDRIDWIVPSILPPNNIGAIMDMDLSRNPHFHKVLQIM